MDYIGQVCELFQKEANKTDDEASEQNNMYNDLSYSNE